MIARVVKEGGKEGGDPIPTTGSCYTIEREWEHCSAGYYHMRINVVAALVSLTTKYSLENVKLTRDTYMRGFLQWGPF